MGSGNLLVGEGTFETAKEKGGKRG